MFETHHGKEQQRFVALERLIMTLVARHGEQTLTVEGEDGAEAQSTIAQYVHSELATDGLTFRSSLYARMLADIVERVGTEGFSISKFLLNNPQLDISREAVNLLSEQYQLSKGQVMASEQETAAESVVHLMFDYKYAIVGDELRRISTMLADPSVVNDSDKCQEVMNQYAILSDIQRRLAKQLGERVFLK
jgi:hypothetical protein